MIKPTEQPEPTRTIRIHRGRTQPVPGEIYPAHLVGMYEFIEAYIAVNKYPPTNREMVDQGFSRSTSVIRFYYDRMVQYGMIKVIPGIARGIRLCPRKEWKKHAQVTTVAISKTIQKEA